MGNIIASCMSNSGNSQEGARKPGRRGIPSRWQRVMGDRMHSLLAIGVIAPIPGWAPGTFGPGEPRGQGYQGTGSLPGSSAASSSSDSLGLTSLPVSSVLDQDSFGGPVPRAGGPRLPVPVLQPGHIGELPGVGLEGSTPPGAVASSQRFGGSREGSG